MVVPTPVDTFTASLFLDINHKNTWYAILNPDKFYKIHKIPKGNGNFRILHEPLSIIRTAQEKVADVFLRPIPLGSHVGAYVNKRGVKYTSTRHSNKNVVVELDIKDFFGSTSCNKLKKFFVNHVGQSEKVAEFLALILTVRIKSNRRGVPQGSPASPLICNLVADKLIDQPIIDHLKKLTGWEYTRYSDNLIFSSDTTDYNDVKRLIGKVNQIVNISGYRLNKNKTKTLWNRSPHRPQRVLGLTLNSSAPNIPRTRHLKLRAIVHTAKKLGWDSVYGVPFDVSTAMEKYNYVLGQISYYYNINPNSRKVAQLWSGIKAVKPHGTNTVRNTNTGGKSSNRNTRTSEGPTAAGSGTSQGHIYDTSAPSGSSPGTNKVI